MRLHINTRRLEAWAPVAVSCGKPDKMRAGSATRTKPDERRQLMQLHILTSCTFDWEGWWAVPTLRKELFQLPAEITQLYVSKGYITSGAYMPPQKLQTGVVEIRVVEGKLEGIKVSGTRRLNPGYVRSRLAIATGKPLNRDRLLRALQLLQLNPLIQNL